MQISVLKLQILKFVYNGMKKNVCNKVHYNE